MVPFEYGAVCLSDCFMYLCKKIRFVSHSGFLSQRNFCTTASLLWAHIGARLADSSFLLFSGRADTAI